MTEQIRTNRKPQVCTFCGILVPAGEGSLVYLDDENVEDMFGPLAMVHSGWHVFCLDKDGCGKRVKEARREYEVRERVRREEAARQEVERREAFERGKTADQAFFAELTSQGCIAAGYVWSREIMDNPDLRTGDRVHTSVHPEGYVLKTRARGQEAHTHHFGNACVLWAPVAIVEEAWERAWQEHVASIGLTRAAIGALSSFEFYQGCAGNEYVAYVMRVHGEDIRGAVRGQTLYTRPRTNLEETEHPVLVAKYGMVQVKLIEPSFHPKPGEFGYDDADRIRKAHNAQFPAVGNDEHFQRIYKTEDGRLIGETYRGRFLEVSK
jgi:hypothetical protein